MTRPARLREPNASLEDTYQGLGYLSQSIQRAFDVLEVLATRAGSDGGLTLTELSTRLHLPKSTTLRLLANLEARGFVEQDNDRRYRIGLALFAIGSRAVSGNDVRRRARPYLEELVQKVGESAYLVILNEDQALYIDRIESPQPVRAVTPIGSHRPLHASAVGKVLLAFMSLDQVDSIIARTGLPPRTDRTVTDRAALRQRIGEIARLGYDLDFDEYEEGLTCMAAPIFDSSKRVVAALGLSGPSWRLKGESVDSAIVAMRNAAKSISSELGFQPNQAEISTRAE